MTIRHTFRIRPRTPGPVVEELTNHWRLVGGRWCRDAVVRLPDGTRRLYALPDGAAA